MKPFRSFYLFFVLLLPFVFSACSTTGEGARRDRVTERVGEFSAPPRGVDRPRVGVMEFTTEEDIFGYSITGNELGQFAADQMTTMLFKTRRFSVIERAQLEKLLQEQNLKGIVKAGEVARMGEVRGVDYLLIGKITNFRVKEESKSDGIGVGGRISRELLDGIGGGINQSESVITTEVGVDIRLVNPETGEVRMAEFSEYERTDTAKAFGFNVAGISKSGNAGVNISKDDAGQVLRLAFEDALKKAMPQIDRILVESHRSAVSGATGTVQPANLNSGEEETSGTANFCPKCGAKNKTGGAFCSACGHKF